MKFLTLSLAIVAGIFSVIILDHNALAQRASTAGTTPGQSGTTPGQSGSLPITPAVVPASDPIALATVPEPSLLLGLLTVTGLGLVVKRQKD